MNSLFQDFQPKIVKDFILIDLGLISKKPIPPPPQKATQAGCEPAGQMAVPHAHHVRCFPICDGSTVCILQYRTWPAHPVWNFLLNPPPPLKMLSLLSLKNLATSILSLIPIVPTGPPNISGQGTGTCGEIVHMTALCLDSAPSEEAPHCPILRPDFLICAFPYVFVFVCLPGYSNDCSIVLLCRWRSAMPHLLLC